MKPFTIVFSGEEGVEGPDGGDDLTSVQCKTIHNCHNESSLYNEYMLIKIFKTTIMMYYLKFYGNWCGVYACNTVIQRLRQGMVSSSPV
jgi:hypothetical protein